MPHGMNQLHLRQCSGVRRPGLSSDMSGQSQIAPSVPAEPFSFFHGTFGILTSLIILNQQVFLVTLPKASAHMPLIPEISAAVSSHNHGLEAQSQDLRS